jgi:hypothetical protein
VILAARPFRFLILVLGGWVAVRAGALWLGGQGVVAAGSETFKAPPIMARAEGSRLPLAGSPAKEREAQDGRDYRWLRGLAPLESSRSRASAAMTLTLLPPQYSSGQKPAALPGEPAIPAQGRGISLAPATVTQSGSRWSGEAWAFVRPDGEDRLIPSPVLGGSQIGGRIRYRLSARLHASARFYAPAGDLGAGDLALGLEWQPVPSLPVRLLAERRTAFNERGRSAFSLLAHGGATRPLAGGALDLYGQAGVAGLRSKTLFADGSAALRWRVDEGRGLRAGVGLWAAAQTGTSRVDVGPTLSVRPVPALPATLSLDWRQRVAGEAAPSSGPALTFTTAF